MYWLKHRTKKMTRNTVFGCLILFSARYLVNGVPEENEQKKLIHDCLRPSEGGWTWICPTQIQKQHETSNPSDQVTRESRSKSPRPVRRRRKKIDPLLDTGNRDASAHKRELDITDALSEEHPLPTHESVSTHLSGERPQISPPEGLIGLY